jgi:hypothetical protein
MKMAVFWVVAPCSLVVRRRFNGACCLHDPDYHGTTTQKTAIFILASARTSHLTGSGEMRLGYEFLVLRGLKPVSSEGVRFLSTKKFGGNTDLNYSFVVDNTEPAKVKEIAAANT